MTVTEVVYDYFERFGNDATMEAGRKLEEARTIEEEEFWGDVVDGLLDMEDE